MYPDEKVSPLQELQMTTNLEPNVHCIAIDGSFDDCQNLMKSIFGDLAFKKDFRLGAINSVNWARIMAQIVYYAYAALKLGGKSSFAVPTGNFGNVFAAYVAYKMGFPIGKLVVATNENDILHRFFSSGDYSRGTIHFTTTPAMDIQVASNFERLLYYRVSGDAVRVTRYMNEFAESGKVILEDLDTDDLFLSTSVSSSESLEVIQSVKDKYDYLLDPHSAVGYTAATQFMSIIDQPIVAVATAHPAKFPEALALAGIDPVSIHPKLESLKGLPIRRELFRPEEETIKEFIATSVR